MKPQSALVLAAAFTALPIVLASQSAAPATHSIRPNDGRVTKTTSITLTQASSCPVSLQAKQGSGSGLVTVRKAQPKDGEPLTQNKPGQHIHLILGKTTGGAFSDLRQIAAATVTARGLSARDHIVGTPALIGNTTFDLERTLGVSFVSEKDGSASADLDLPGFTSVQSIQIESIEFRDGSKWTIAGNQHCVVTPDSLMLIANQ